MKFGLGCLRDPPNYPHKSFEWMRYRISAVALPRSVDLRGVAAPVMDQGPTGSCVGHGFAGAIYTSLRSKSSSAWIPSPSWIYRSARSIQRIDDLGGIRPAKLPPLVDTGAYPSRAIQAIESWGLRRLKGTISDVTRDNVNRELTLTELRESAERLLRGAYEIKSATKVDTVKQVLAAKIAVAICTYVDDEFCDYSGGSVLGPSLTDGGGGHCMYILGYELRNGALAFRIRNSWGIGWGEYGDCLVNSEFIDKSWNLFAMDVM